MIACGSEAPSPTTADPVVAAAPTVAADPAEEGSFTASGSVSSCEVSGGPDVSLSGSSYLSASGIETLICRGSANGTPPPAVVYYGVNCYLPQTNDWTTNAQLVVYPRGGAVLRCQGR